MCSQFSKWKKSENTITNPEQDALIIEWLQRTREWAQRNMEGVDPNNTSHEAQIYEKNLSRVEACNELLEYLAH